MMRMAFPPPLALGMEGRDERLEFKTRSVLDPASSLAALNSSAPDGLRFLGLRPLERDAPPLSRRLRGMVYSVDLEHPAVRDALAGPGPDGGTAEFVRRKIEAAELPAGGPDIRLDQARNRLVIAFRFDPGKAPRPQDVLSAVLGLANPASVLVRDAVLVD